jgi:hypothetical protein
MSVFGSEMEDILFLSHWLATGSTGERSWLDRLEAQSE